MARRITCVSSCIVTAPWPEAFSRHICVLINPANTALSGPLRGSFPRGGPVPPPGSVSSSTSETSRSLTARLSTSLRSWWGSDGTPPPDADLLYPAQAVDGLVHAEGLGKLKAALAAHPILERRDETGEHIRCHVGDAVLTAGRFNALPFDAIVHTVPPFWPRRAAGTQSEATAQWAADLRSCYDASFRLAIEFAASCDRSSSAEGLAIATPILGSGARGAPFAPAVRVLAEAAAQAFSETRDTTAQRAGSLSLRVVLDPGSLGSQQAVAEAAMSDAMGKRV